MELRRSWFPNLEYTSIRCSRRREDSQSFHPHRRNIRARCHAIQQLFPVNSMGRGVLTRKPREIKHYGGENGTNQYWKNPYSLPYFYFTGMLYGIPGYGSRNGDPHY